MLSQICDAAKLQRECPETRVAGVSKGQYLVVFPENQPTVVRIIDTKKPGLHILADIDYRHRSISRAQEENDQLLLEILQDVHKPSMQ
ncbi:hypothetical protein AVT69_gp033 [Pseudomonas phage PhiPA3]|uniref:Uncharacterized protein 032 n=1 Tax=Pseudomonas phage PhiPA3 TaxID=998086 RepID=F8SJR4_BPPA3|nr:hypothetical protein AVT69_gp033 [Pseudomonas phage PhiPA3]AEH03459.1 hypothetical protein [Pseudomonas phage PhiPA3]